MKENLHVTGMHCSHCEAKVIKKLNSLSGVTACSASHEKELVEVDYDCAAISLETIKECIKSAGFKVS